ncbi:PcfK-like family protein [Bacteroides sp.]|uniref:PcfK-like family protein n=1 Tax=Bacteroides sp. TaxID=29523 RepID=UPI003D0F91DA
MKTSEAFKKTIREYLEQRAKEDQLFAASYAKENKNIDECCNFILGEVQKSGCNGFSDEEIFGMAVHYYDEDDIKNVKPVNARVVVNHTIELTEEDKRKAKEAALKEYEAKEMKRIEEARKKKLEKKAERVAKQEVAPLLFDFEG